MNRSIINLIHLLFVAPMLIYLGIMKEKTNVMVFNFVLIVGIIVLLYHGYLIINTNLKNKFQNNMRNNPTTKSN